MPVSRRTTYSREDYMANLHNNLNLNRRIMNMLKPDARVANAASFF